MKLLSDTKLIGLKINIRYMFIPIAVLVVVFILIVISLKTSLTRIPGLFDQLNQKKEEVVALETKLTVLSSVESEILTQSEKTIYAVPDNNSVLWILNTAKQVADENNIVITGIEIDNSEKSELNSISLEISFQTDSRENIVNFVEGLSQKAPLKTIETIGINNGRNGLLEAGIKLNSYWARLPDKIPALTAPITNLSPDEQESIKLISTLEPPQFTLLTPSEPTERSNPFN